ncbi:MAG: hypothetical protein HIU90_08460 [Proteobacteria bacterium]|nr:hypothetical protein [Pseudomonadota bacterium]
MTTQSQTIARAAMLQNLDIVRQAWEQSHPHRLPLLDAAEMDAATVQFCHAAAPHLLDLVLLDRVQQPVILVLDDAAGDGPGGWKNLDQIARFAAAAIITTAPYRAETFIAATHVACAVNRLAVVETTAAARPRWLETLTVIARHS